ncbi:MAG: S8 family serine peptidase [Thermoanaerobaculia bacterium]
MPRSVAAEAAPNLGRQVLVTLPPGPERLWDRVMVDLASVYSLKLLYFWPLPSLGEDCLIYELPPGRDPEEMAARLARDRRVSSAQPIHVFRVLSDPYNDPYANLQHGLRSLGLAQAQTVARGRGVKVAVVDTGVDFSHPDLQARVVKASNFVNWGEPAFTGDVHGTAVAGVIAADANNRTGIVGVAPEAELLALKACWQDPPQSRQALCNSYTLAEAVDFALREGAQVMNFSLAGPSDPLLAKLLNRAIEQGVTVVAAAPEHGVAESFPASLPGVLAVRATDLEGQLRSPAGSEGAGPLLAAPGVDILATTPHSAYDFFTGSSLAAAEVSGVVALMLEKSPQLKPAEVRALLAETGRPAPEAGQPAGAAQARQVNACAVLARLGAALSCAEPAP